MFTKATKKQAKLRCAIFGASGAGKTYSALAIASGMSDKIALIDTENFTASKYADSFSFDTANLKDQSIQGYCNAINNAAKANYEVLIIDSLSHGWKDLLAEIEKIAKAKYRGNTWSAWSEGTPLQQKLIRSIINFPHHIIVTMRSKTEWTTEKTERGSNKPVRIGLSPEQGKGIEYEFDILMELSTEHIGNIIKDRTGKYQDTLIEKPGKEFGKELIEWLNTGEEVVNASFVATPVLPQVTLSLTEAQLYKLYDAISIHDIDVNKMLIYYKIPTIEELLPKYFEQALKAILAKPIKVIKEPAMEAEAKEKTEELAKEFFGEKEDKANE